MPEKLIPVKSESELRVGMKVVLRTCEKCGRDHAAMLLGVAISEHDRPTWRHYPEMHPVAGRVRGLNAKRSIEMKALFRVDDGLTDEDLRVEREIIRGARLTAERFALRANIDRGR